MAIDKSKIHSTDVISWLKREVESMENASGDIPFWAIEAFCMSDRGQETAPATLGSPERTRNVKMDDQFRSELVYFKIEDTTFTVIKEWIMIEGTPFHDMLTLPPPECGENAVEGTLITRPIVLEQTTVSGFKAFLNLLYGSKGKDVTTIDECASALELALRWNFPEVRKKAFTALDNRTDGISVGLYIHLGRRFSCAHWLRFGIFIAANHMCSMSVPPSALINAEEYPLDAESIANILYCTRELDKQGALPADFNDEMSEHSQLMCANCRACPRTQRSALSSCSKCRHSPSVTALWFKIIEEVFTEELNRCLYKDSDDFL